MTRDDVVRITESILSELRITVTDGDFTDPNSRVVTLYHGDRVLSYDYFDVSQQDEYGG